MILQDEKWNFQWLVGSVWSHCTPALFPQRSTHPVCCRRDVIGLQCEGRAHPSAHLSLHGAPHWWRPVRGRARRPPLVPGIQRGGSPTQGREPWLLPWNAADQELQPVPELERWAGVSMGSKQQHKPRVKTGRPEPHMRRRAAPLDGVTGTTAVPAIAGHWGQDGPPSFSSL